MLERLNNFAEKILDLDLSVDKYAPLLTLTIFSLLTILALSMCSYNLISNLIPPQQLESTNGAR